MENTQTGEVLALYHNANSEIYARYNMRYFLIRHRKGEEHLKANWEKQLQQLNKLPNFAIEISGFGVKNRPFLI